ncbi:MAG: glycosyltransferase family 2 protein [Cyclobacteriaceae bacterium]|nr:glycosyltransferase family 2 protein [Cyclobacteriaceae bacterium]
MPDPFFTVVIPTYNRAHSIRVALDSVLAQTFTDFEVVVVDDGSKDDTASVVREMTDPRIRYYYKDNGERAAARNYGVAQANGRYVNFLDSDDEFYPNHLQAAFDFLSGKSIEVCHFGYDVKDPNGKVLRVVKSVDSINRQIVGGNVLSCNGVFAKREVLQKHGFNEDRSLSSLEDWELWIRLCSRFTFHHVALVTSTVRDHDQRSVVAGSREAIERKVDLLIQYATGDEGNRAYFGNRISRIVASAHTYAALHLRMAGAPRVASWRHLGKGLRACPLELFRRRTMVILLMLLGIK